MTRIDYADFLPIFPLETEEVIRARWNAWANEGLAAGDPRVRDVREGSFFQIVTEGGIRSAAQVYDRMSEIVAMSNPLFAGGYYLDLIAVSRGIPRLTATRAIGTVTFTGTAGTVIPSGTPVSSPSVVSGDPNIDFQTDVSVTIPAGGQVSVAITAVNGGSAANLAAAAVNTTLLPSLTVTNATPTAGGSEVESDDHLASRIIGSYQSVGGANTEVVRGWALAYPGVGRATVRPNYFGAGTVLLIVSSTDGSPVSAATLVALQNKIDPATMATTLSSAVTFPAATISVVSSSGARVPASGGSDYLNVNGQIISYTGITGNTFTGVSGGTGMVASGSSVNQEGAGAGLAPIGMYVQVQTTSLLPIDVVASVRVLSGYGVATVGLVDVTPFISKALSDYIDAVPPGGTVVLSQVLARIAEAQGVSDVDYASLTVAGVHANVAVSDNPAKKPYLRTLTLSTY